MKKIFLLTFILIFTLQTVSAKNYTLHFNGEKYTLLYSAKNKDFGGYINEYFKPRETYNIWSEMIAVHHFPNAYSPIDGVRDFKEYLGSLGVPSALTFDDKKNTATIDFIMISNSQMPIVMEFNIFKYEKSKKCGSIAVQYAKRYSATTTLQVEQIKEDFEKNRKNLIKKVQKLNIPEVIDFDIDKCINALDIKSQTDMEIKKEKEALELKEKEEALKASEASKVEENKTDDTENIVENSAKNEELKEAKDVKSETTSEIKTEEKTVKLEEKTAEAETAAKTDNIVETKNIEKSAEENKAPVPAATTVKTDDTIKTSKNKKSKDSGYEVKNTKNDFIAEPRTKKELKNEVKQNKIKQKQLAKESKKQAKIDMKNQKSADKLAKKQAKIDKINSKKAEKMAKKPYEFTNSNSELIAKPRTKKELKAQNKKLKKQAKQRAKEAKKKLSE